MDTAARLDLIKQVGEEIITEQELAELLKSKSKIVAYDGFEPSGTGIHIAQGILRAININKMTRSGVKFKMLVADWHSWANNKLGGDLDNIHLVGSYMIEVWKLCDMDLKNVEFVWASDLLNNRDYWKTVVQIARLNTIKRLMRTVEIMGRKESETLYGSQMIYPCMQAADIFHLKADICQLGMDQRKVNVLAREIADKLGFCKPVIVSHHMLMGLGEPPKAESQDRIIELKMSKSRPDTAIFMHDSEEDIRRKIRNAYCPAKITKENPILEYCKHLIFEKYSTIEIKRPGKFGGDIVIETYKELEELYEKGELHPADLKTSAAEYINKMVEPVREGIRKNKKLAELKEKIGKFEVTR